MLLRNRVKCNTIISKGKQDNMNSSSKVRGRGIGWVRLSRECYCHMTSSPKEDCLDPKEDHIVIV